MKGILLLGFLVLSCSAQSFYDFAVKDIFGNDVRMRQRYSGKTVLVVNTASLCGFTRQLNGLEELYTKYKDRGFEVAAFPSPTFHQEFKTNKEILDFTRNGGTPAQPLGYRTTFHLYSPVQVNGAETAPLFSFLKSALPKAGGVTDIAWNFEKFLVGSDGRPIRRYISAQTPQSFEQDIVSALPTRRPNNA